MSIPESGMSDRAEPGEGSADAAHHAATVTQAASRPRVYHVYLLMLLATALLYVLSGSLVHRFNRTVVPTGDPFLYTSNFFYVVDGGHDDYFRTLRHVVTSRNGVWLTHLLVALFSPVLVKEPQSITLINFAVFFLATVSAFRLARQLGATTPAAFLLAFTIWLAPFLYGLSCPVSLLVLMLDTTFVGMLFVATVNLVMFASRPLDTKQAALAGLTAGLAVWGRGNSLPYVLIAAGCPLLVISWELLTDAAARRSKQPRNLLLFLGLFSAMAAWYYGYNLKQILGYYSYLPCVDPSKSAVTEKLGALVHPALWVTTNIPGIFFDPGAIMAAIHIDSVAMTWFSCAIHLLVLLSVLGVFCRRWRGADKVAVRPLRIACATGAMLYGGVYLMCLTGVGPFHEHRPYHTFAPMLAGLGLSVVSVIAPSIIARGEARFLRSRIFMPAVILLAVLYAYWWNHQHSAIEPLPGADSPLAVERFALELDHHLQDRKLAVVWYNVYNRGILGYYRVKNDRPALPLFVTYERPLFHTVADQIDYQDFRSALRKTMQEADFVIIPEDLRNYALLYPCSLQRYGAREMADFLDSPDCPAYAIREIMHDRGGCRLLLLQRLNPDDRSENCVLLKPANPVFSK